MQPGGLELGRARAIHYEPRGRSWVIGEFMDRSLLPREQTGRATRDVWYSANGGGTWHALAGPEGFVTYCDYLIVKCRDLGRLRFGWHTADKLNSATTSDCPKRGLHLDRIDKRAFIGDIRDPTGRTQSCRAHRVSYCVSQPTQERASNHRINVCGE